MRHYIDEFMTRVAARLVFFATFFCINFRQTWQDFSDEFLCVSFFKFKLSTTFSFFCG